MKRPIRRVRAAVILKNSVEWGGLSLPSRFAYFLGGILLLAIFLSFPRKARAANCASPARAEGTIIYNSDYHILQYCNGTSWIPFRWGDSSHPTLTLDALVDAAIDGPNSIT